MKIKALYCAVFLLQASSIYAEGAKPIKQHLVSFEFGDTIQYALNNIVALDDTWSPDHLPEDKSHLDHTFFGHSPPVYPSRKFLQNLADHSFKATII